MSRDDMYYRNKIGPYGERRIEKDLLSFDEAVKALFEGRRIKKKGDSAWYTKDTILELSLEDIITGFCLYNDWIVSD